jgi:hypothetical protein
MALSASGVRVDVEGLELSERGEAQERVAADEAVVEEAEGTLPIHRDEPHRELGHLHGQRVHVDPVKAVFGHQSTGSEDHRFDFGIGGPVGTTNECPTGFEVAFGVPRLDDTIGQVASGGDKEGAAAHGDVHHPQGE